MLGAIMFMSKFLMQMLPSVHLLGLFIASITLTYRAKALIPIYVFILLDVVYWGLSAWEIPKLYVWLPLWLIFMLVGKINLPIKVQTPLYMLLCALHGLSFGALYAPVHAIMFGLNFQGMIAWIIVGLPFDIVHSISNFAAGTLIVPLALLLKRLDKGKF